jgi:hypothetical protein
MMMCPSNQCLLHVSPMPLRLTGDGSDESKRVTRWQLGYHTACSKLLLFMCKLHMNIFSGRKVALFMRLCNTRHVFSRLELTARLGPRHLGHNTRATSWSTSGQRPGRHTCQCMLHCRLLRQPNLTGWDTCPKTMCSSRHPEQQKHASAR